MGRGEATSYTALCANVPGSPRAYLWAQGSRAASSSLRIGIDVFDCFFLNLFFKIRNKKLYFKNLFPRSKGKRVDNISWYI